MRAAFFVQPHPSAFSLQVIFLDVHPDDRRDTREAVDHDDDEGKVAQAGICRLSGTTSWSTGTISVLAPPVLKWHDDASCVTTLQKAMLRPTLFSHRKLEVRVASLAISAASARTLRSPMGWHRHRIARPQRENRSVRAAANHLSVLRCRWPVRIALTRAQFAHFPGECLKPETRWRSGVDSNPRYREGFYGREFRRSLRVIRPDKSIRAGENLFVWNSREFVRLEFDSASALSGSFRSRV
jgi:hypothetical protein